jgi:hypothetical protein
MAWEGNIFALHLNGVLFSARNFRSPNIHPVGGRASLGEGAITN